MLNLTFQQSGLILAALLLLLTLSLLWRRRRRKEQHPSQSQLEVGQALDQALAKTRGSIIGRLEKAFAGGETEGLGPKIEEILFTADLGVATSQKLLAALAEEQGALQNLQQAKQLLAAKIRGMLPADGGLAATPDKHPYVLLMVGVNGVGKTTTIGKLAHIFKSRGDKVLLAAADTYRKAAIEQLAIWAERNEIDLVRQDYGSDPGAVAFDAIKSAAAKAADVVIIDTAGRLHTKHNLMEELKKIKRVCAKAQAGAPHEVLLVVDATTGQNAIVQAKEFNEAVGLTGLIVTKLDGTAKGGIVVGIADELKLNIPYIGIGEGLADLKPFAADAFIKALFVEGEVHG